MELNNDRSIIIIGTGAVSAELTAYIFDNNKTNKNNFNLKIKGYIEYEHNIEKYYNKYQLEGPILGDIDSYKFSEEDEVLIGISDLVFRKSIIEILEKKKVKIINFIHNSAIIAENVTIGKGNIVYPHVIIGPLVEIGNHNLITSYSFISHDCVIGNNNFFSTTGIAGRVCIGNNNFFGIRSTILPNLNVGDKNVIQAGMVVYNNLGNNNTVFYRFKEQIIAYEKDNK
jgi:UDP-3-O-[3-hydroxymyristoyl] glucosamine N-acyltransferase